MTAPRIVAPCICDHTLMQHDNIGMCHGTYGVALSYCSCRAYRTEAQAATVAQPPPDWAKVVRLLESIEYNTRRHGR